MRRDWSDAHAKVELEGRCRVCGTDRLRREAAHVIGRRYDSERGGVVYVEPDDVVPLCAPCHGLYDARKLDVLPFLSYAEQARAALHVGLVRALHRTTSA